MLDPDNHSGGFNPMRWNCDSQGCFNIKCRPKLEVFSECFPRRINFGDVDGLVELNNSFLMLEWKDKNSSITKGQKFTYIRLSAINHSAVIVVNGSAETMRVESFFTFQNGQQKDLQNGTLEDLKTKIRGWVSMVEGKRHD